MAEPEFVPKRIGDLLGNVAAICDCNVKLTKLNSFLNELKDEMRKIDAFKRELPLCMILLEDAIELLKEETKQCAASGDKKLKPVFEEFIPMKRVCEEKEKEKEKEEEEETVETKDKKNWLSSVQLWNSPENPSTDHRSSSFGSQREEFKTESKIDRAIPIGNEGILQGSKGRAETRSFLPFKAFNMLPGKEGSSREELAAPALVAHGIKHQREESGPINLVVPPLGVHLQSHQGAPISHQPGTPRKQRRCWSSELHSRFCKALDQLGGCHVATPKQIRELMQVDGLTNDEVKSHLQKYRLHTRRAQQTSSPTRSSQSTVLLGGLWMSQDGDSSKEASFKSGSPQSPLQLASNTRADSTEDDDDDIASEGYSWMTIGMSRCIEFTRHEFCREQ